MFAGFGEYLWGLADHWAAFMTGGIPALLLLVIERLRGKQLPLKAFLTLLALGFVVAIYQDHKQLRDELTAQQLANSAIKADLKSAGDLLADTRRQLVEAQKWIPFRERSPIGPSGANNNTFKNLRLSGGDVGMQITGPFNNNVLENVEINARKGIVFSPK